jgi:hypothetical protein
MVVSCPLRATRVVGQRRARQGHVPLFMAALFMAALFMAALFMAALFMAALCMAVLANVGSSTQLLQAARCEHQTGQPPSAWPAKPESRIRLEWVGARGIASITCCWPAHSRGKRLPRKTPE